MADGQTNGNSGYQGLNQGVDSKQFQQNPLDIQTNYLYQSPNQQQHPSPCPSCGHCPTCGRGGYGTNPWYQPQPWQPNITLNVPMTTTTGNIPSVQTSGYMQEIKGLK